jgi:hypothetical protein
MKLQMLLVAGAMCASTNIKKRTLHLFKDYEQQINYLLAQKPMTVDELELAVDPAEKDVFIEVIRELVDSEEVYYDEVWVLHKK